MKMIFEPETGAKLTPIPTKKDIESSLAFKLEPAFIEQSSKEPSTKE
jgi:hypothetical protein